jgi:hypothetical protein
VSALAQQIHDLIVANQGKTEGFTLNQIQDLCLANGATVPEPPGYDAVEAEADALESEAHSDPLAPLTDVETEGGGDPGNASGEGADAEPT